MQYAGRVSDINLVNGPTHHEFFVADLLQLILISWSKLN